jgi:hypothetical protein
LQDDTGETIVHLYRRFRPAVFANFGADTLITHKYRGSIVVISISKSVEPNEEQKEMTSGFRQVFSADTEIVGNR